MPRLTHKQLLHELRTVVYPLVGTDTKKLRLIAKKLQSDPDPTMKHIGDFTERACNLLDKVGTEVLG